MCETTLETNLDTIIDNLTTQLLALIAEKTSVLGEIAALTSPDVTSMASSGVAGSESFSFISLNQRLQTIMSSEIAASEELERMILLRSKLDRRSFVNKRVCVR